MYILHHCLFHLRYYVEVNRRNKLGWFNIKRSSYQSRKSHRGEKTVLPLHNGFSYTGKMTSVYWIRFQVIWIDMYFMEPMYAYRVNDTGARDMRNYNRRLPWIKWHMIYLSMQSTLLRHLPSAITWHHRRGTLLIGNVWRDLARGWQKR